MTQQTKYMLNRVCDSDYTKLVKFTELMRLYVRIWLYAHDTSYCSAKWLLYDMKSSKGNIAMKILYKYTRTYTSDT